jgi:hypothetical protein
MTLTASLTHVIQREDPTAPAEAHEHARQTPHGPLTTLTQPPLTFPHPPKGGGTGAPARPHELMDGCRGI